MPVSIPLPRVIAPESVPALRWGIVGTGIAQRFVRAIHTYTGQRAVAVGAVRGPAAIVAEQHR